jgi:hypothetical protein
MPTLRPQSFFRPSAGCRIAGLLLVLCASLLLTACSTREAPDLAPLLVHTGDLPAGMAAGEVQSAADPQYPWSAQAQPIQQISQALTGAAPFVPDGEVTIWRFPSAGAAATTYADSVQSMAFWPKTPAVYDGIGEQRGVLMTLDGTVLMGEGGIQGSSSFVFARCTTLVRVTLHMRRSDVAATAPLDQAIQAYARRLDARLAAAVCI